MDPASFELVELPEFLSPSSTSSSSLQPSPNNWATRPTECVVCGNATNGYHYNVASCNGCKTFFRRVCLSEKTFQCKFNGDCFDLEKREKPRRCRSCRHQKCISVGMNPLAMEINEKEASSENFKKLVKRMNIEEEVDDCIVVLERNSQKKQLIKMVDSPENRLQKMIDGLVYLEVKVEQFRRSSYNPPWQELKGLVHLLETENRISYADRYGLMPGWPLQYQPSKPSPPPTPGRFGAPKYDPNTKQWFLYNLMTTVEYAKTFMFFHKLSSQDKLILTRYVTLACVNLHVSFSSLEQKFDVPINPDRSEPMFKDGEHYTVRVMSVAPLIRCQIQNVEYLLLKAICLCNPAVPDLSAHAQRVISTERHLYAKALFDHCLRTRDPAHFAQLIQIIDVLERQQRMQKDLYLLNIAPHIQTLPKEYLIQVIADIMEY